MENRRDALAAGGRGRARGRAGRARRATRDGRDRRHARGRAGRAERDPRTRHAGPRRARDRFGLAGPPRRAHPCRGQRDRRAPRHPGERPRRALRRAGHARPATGAGRAATPRGATGSRRPRPGRAPVTTRSISRRSCRRCSCSCRWRVARATRRWKAPIRATSPTRPSWSARCWPRWRRQPL